MSKNYGTLQDKNGNSLFPVGIETVTNSNGTALKFADGTMVCYGQNTVLITTEKQFGNTGLYYGYCNNVAKYPTSFISEPITQILAETTADLPCIQKYPKSKDDTNSINRKTDVGGFYPVTVGAVTTTISLYITYIAIGRWK